MNDNKSHNNLNLQKRVLGASEVVEMVFQNKLAVALAVLTEERQRVTAKEVKRAPHRDREQWEHLREIATLQITVTVLRRPQGKRSEGQEEQIQARDNVRRKTQSWTVMRNLSMISPEVTTCATAVIISGFPWTCDP